MIGDEGHDSEIARNSNMSVAPESGFSKALQRITCTRSLPEAVLETMIFVSSEGGLHYFAYINKDGLRAQYAPQWIPLVEGGAAVASVVAAKAGATLIGCLLRCAEQSLGCINNYKNAGYGLLERMLFSSAQSHSDNDGNEPLV